MLSYRENLKNIGIGANDVVSYQAFYSKPQSLRAAILSMQAPASEDWSQVVDISEDQSWTDEVQGVANDGTNWIFSANANQAKPGIEDKALYVFGPGAKFEDNQWKSRLKYKNVPHPIAGKESNDHWGTPVFFNGSVFVGHFWEGTSKAGTGSAVVFQDTAGILTYSRWIELDKPTSPTDSRQANAEFVGINPWDGMLYSCFGDGTINELFIHEIDGINVGKFTGRTLKLNPPVSDVQGVCFSPNGHLYISTNEHPDDDEHQPIWYYSALNGHRFGRISVLSKESNQELEGICFASATSSSGTPCQIHAILLENHDVAKDNITQVATFDSVVTGTAGIR